MPVFLSTFNIFDVLNVLIDDYFIIFYLFSVLWK